MAPNEACSRSREWISLDLDSALSRFEGAWLRRHLRSCAGCRAYATDVRGATTLLRADPLVPRPTPVVVPAAARKGGLRSAARVGLAAATVAAMAALAAGGLTSGSSDRSGSDGATASGAPSDLSSMRLIRRQTLSTGATAEPRVRVVEID
ncbi:MAG TPA: zf-HC2 domain-containing protein [Gaiellaceae bacterium]